MCFSSQRLRPCNFFSLHPWAWPGPPRTLVGQRRRESGGPGDPVGGGPPPPPAALAARLPGNRANIHSPQPALQRKPHHAAAAADGGGGGGGGCPARTAGAARSADKTMIAFSFESEGSAPQQTSPPPRRAARARGGGWMGPEVGPAFQRRSRGLLPFLLGVRSKRPGNSGLRAAIRTAARARSGRANATDGICWEWSSFPTTASDPSRSLLASGWHNRVLRSHHQDSRDREQVGQVRCWGFV
eukprot:gene25598-biopygen1466